MDNDLNREPMTPTRLETMRVQRIENGTGWRVHTLPTMLICASCLSKIEVPVYFCEDSHLIYCKQCEKRTDQSVCPKVSVDHSHILIADAEWREK